LVRGKRDGVWSEHDQQQPSVQVLEFHLPHSEEAPTLARRLVEEQLMPLLPGRRADELLLLVSELVTNAVRHSEPLPDGTIGLQFERTPDGVRVAVTDGGKHLVPDGLAFHSETNGHFGLFFVDKYADRWGFSLDGVKGVWFMVDLADG
jgi:anti-sigma regulatory factor (Ser/Thr protein kinase)